MDEKSSDLGENGLVVADPQGVGGSHNIYTYDIVSLPAKISFAAPRHLFEPSQHYVKIAASSPESDARNLSAYTSTLMLV
jgi:hypothetical protein